MAVVAQDAAPTSLPSLVAVCCCLFCGLYQLPPLLLLVIGPMQEGPRVGACNTYGSQQRQSHVRCLLTQLHVSAHFAAQHRSTADSSTCACFVQDKLRTEYA